jgi:hypothetical protein
MIVQMMMDGWFTSRSTIPLRSFSLRPRERSVVMPPFGSSVQISMPRRSATS